MDPQQVADAILAFKWLPLAIIIIGYLTRLLSDESKFPVSIPVRWHPVIVISLGQTFGVLTAIAAGARWYAAIVVGLVTAFCTMGMFDVLVKAVFNGKPPWWIDILALVFPPKKTTDAGSYRTPSND